MPRRTATKENQSKRGSENEPRFLIIGRFRKPHGVRGELKVAIQSDDPERFQTLKRVYVSANPEDYNPKKLKVLDVRFHHHDALLRIDGVDTPEEARRYNSQWLFVAIEDASVLDEGEMFTWQMVGLAVVTEDGVALGQVASVLETGANDVLVLSGEKGEILLPDIPDVVKEIDLEAGKVVVALLPGLLPDS